MFKPTEFKIWYIHQIPGKTFEKGVESPEIGQQILDTVYEVMLFMFENRMIADYSNTGGIVFKDEDGEWSDYDPEEWEELS